MRGIESKNSISAGPLQVHITHIVFLMLVCACEYCVLRCVVLCCVMLCCVYVREKDLRVPIAVLAALLEVGPSQARHGNERQV